MPNDNFETSNRDQVFELIVRQALKIKTWRRKCSKMMKEHKIDKASVELELAHRKAILKKKPIEHQDFRVMPFTEEMEKVTTALGEDAHWQDINLAYREQHLEKVVRKALSSSSWKKECATTMQDFGITAEEVESEVAKRREMLK